MVEVVLTADDLRLADEMNHLYGAKARKICQITRWSFYGCLWLRIVLRRVYAN